MTTHKYSAISRGNEPCKTYAARPGSQIQLLDFNYTHDLLKVDTNGRFTTDIDMAKVYLSYNNTDIDDLVPYQCYNDIYHTSLIYLQL